MRGDDYPSRLLDALGAGQFPELELLNLVLRRLPPLADRHPAVPLALAAGLHEVQLVLARRRVPHREEHGGAEGPDAPVEGEHVQVVGHPVGEDLGRDLIAVEGLVVGALGPGAGHDLARVGGETGARHARVAIDGRDPAVGARHQHLEREELLHAEHDAVDALDAQRQSTVIHSLARVVHLEHLPVGGVGGGGQVVPRADAGHRELRGGGSSRRVGGLRSAGPDQP